MRLKKFHFHFSLKTRAFFACGLWACVGIATFLCSETGQQFSKWSQQMWQTAGQKSGRSLQQVFVDWQEPNHYTKREEILKTIGVARGDAMADIDLNEMKQKIEALPWVRQTVVERYWPNTIKITIAEKMPLALWQNNRQYHPLDEQAKIIDTTKQLPADLLLVVGPDAPKHLVPLIRDLEQVPDIYQYVRAAVRINERRWNLKLFNAEKGVDVLLPETGVLDALQRLENHNKKEKLIKRQVAAIDLRTKDKVILKPIENGAQLKKVSKK